MRIQTWATLAAALVILCARPCEAALWIVPSLGQTVHESDAIIILEVTHLDEAKSTITYKTIKELKGKSAFDHIAHRIEPKHEALLRWAAIGKKAVLFLGGKDAFALLCIDHHWYGMARAKGIWEAYPASQLCFSCCGHVAELGAALPKLLAGHEVIVPCALTPVPSKTVSINELDELRKRDPKLGNVRASLKLKSFDPRRNLVADDTASFDLAKIRRVPVKELPYNSRPDYCLLVFGLKADTQVWLVRDGEVLYVDRNGNGDLTEKGEQFAGTKYPNGTIQWRVGNIVEKDGKTRHTDLRVWLRQRGNYTLHLGRTADGLLQEVGNEIGALRFEQKAQDAPIVHLGGPLTFLLSQGEGAPLEFTPGKETGFIALVGTAGLGEGTGVYSHVEDFGKFKMLVEVAFPQSGGAPFVVRALQPDY